MGVITRRINFTEDLLPANKYGRFWSAFGKYLYMKYLVLYNGVKHVLTVHMSNMAGVFFIYIKNKHGGCPIRGRSYLPPRAPDFNPSCLVVCVLAICLSFFVLSYYISLRSEFRVVMSVTISHKNDIRFVFTSRCLYEGSCLIYFICVCLRIVVSNTYCVVLQLCFVVRCLVYVAGFSGLSICDCHFGFLLTYISRKLIRNSSPSSSSKLANVSYAPVSLSLRSWSLWFLDLLDMTKTRVNHSSHPNRNRNI
jgi:hypothetical protein